MAVRRRGETRIEPSERPYKGGTDLHRLWGWGIRLEGLLEGEPFTATDCDWIVIRACRNAAEAMMRFSIDYPTLIEEIRRQQRDVESRWDEALNMPTEESLHLYADAIDVLAARIFKACELIAEREKPGGKAESGKAKKKIKPQPDTLAVIRMVQAGKNNNEISEATGKSVDNINTIRSRYAKGYYTL